MQTVAEEKYILMSEPLVFPGRMSVQGKRVLCVRTAAPQGNTGTGADFSFPDQQLMTARVSQLKLFQPSSKATSETTFGNEKCKNSS